MVPWVNGLRYLRISTNPTIQTHPNSVEES